MKDMVDINEVVGFINSKNFLEKYCDSLVNDMVNNWLSNKKNINTECIEKIKDKLYFNTSYLANGEYNSNYRISVFYDDEKVDDMVFRVNYASQMNLENQIEYEFIGLKAVLSSGLTPVPYFFDDSKKYFSRDYLLMSFIDGRSMDYQKDMFKVAECLANIHRLDIPTENILLEPTSPFKAILEESTNMYSKYRSSDLFDEKVDQRIGKVFDKARQICNDQDRHMMVEVDDSISRSTLDCKNSLSKSIINTELNSSNFIIGDRAYLVDWEKPIIGEKEQDLGHFLAPTTSFWKTDIIFTKNQVEEFLEYYFDIFHGERSHVDNKLEFEIFKDKVYSYIRMNCLRGLTWCAMAWVEYNKSEKALLNEFTFNKLKAYLSLDYLDMVIENFVED